MRDTNTILLSGYGKLPNNITAEVVYNTLVLAVVADRDTGIILESEASVVTSLTRRFLADMMVGYNLNDGPEALIDSMEQRYLGSAKKALETALRMIFLRYQEYINTRK